MPPLAQRLLGLAAAAVVAAVMLAAAIPKIDDPSAFLVAVRAFELAPPPLDRAVAHGVPWLELVAGLALLLPATRRAGAIVAAALLVVFVAALGLAAARGLSLDCGCFGASEDGSATSIPLAIARNLALLSACAYLAWNRPSPTVTREA